MLRTIKRIIAWSGQRQRRLYTGCVYSFLHTVFTALPVMGAAWGLNLIIEDSRGRAAIDGTWVWYMLGFMLAAVAGRFWFAYLWASAQESIGYEVAAEQRLAIGALLKRVSLGFFSKKTAGEIAAAVTTDLSFLELFGMKMVDVVVNGYISAVTLVLCLALYSWPVALVAAAGIAASAWSLRLLGRKSKANAPVHQSAQDRMIAATLEYLRGMAVVKAFKQDGVARDGIRNAYRLSREINCKIEKEYVPYNCLHLLSLKAAATGVVLAAALLTLAGSMAVPTLLLMAIFSFMIFKQIETVNNAAHVLELIDVTLDKLGELETAEFIDKDGVDRPLPAYDIRFEDVTFAYDRQPVLQNVSFTIPAGTTTAIVGPSGSGKSTICSLIARFYDVNQGRVLIGGVDIKTMTCDSLLAHISMVFQQVYLFHDTVLNNIRFGQPAATMDEVVAAARKACCHDFISKLPNGYETVIGDGGSTLSGGEKQRISIARAILKAAPIVILDEATASVDPENEHLIQQALSALVQGKTMLIIAHRLATIQNADKILVVEAGRIVQQGTHAELRRQDGVYRRFLAIRQAAEGWSLCV